jgi:Domain of unknown function (DUF4258)
MRVRFYIDPATGHSHVRHHNVTEEEVEEVLMSPGEDRPGRENSRVAIGQTDAGRHLRVIYVPDPEPESVFVITAYELQGKPLKAYRRRQRKTKMKQSKFPLGWDEERVRRVLSAYEQQTEEEAVAEDEAAFESSTQTFIEVPNELLPAVRELIAKHKT